MDVYILNFKYIPAIVDNHMYDIPDFPVICTHMRLLYHIYRLYSTLPCVILIFRVLQLGRFFTVPQNRSSSPPG